MRTNIIQIGNSQGVRLPKTLLHACGFDGVTEVEVIVKDHHIIISKADKPRADWGKAFQAMAEQGDDQLLDAGQLKNTWDQTEWKW